MLSQKRLIELLHYGPKTGIFRWRVGRSGTAGVGSIAGGLHPAGYRYICVDGKRYKASRLAWFYMHGYFPENDVDHKNRDRADDRWKNLREVSRQCNNRNCGNRSDNTTGVKGIYFEKQRRKWHAQITVDRRVYYLGRYKDFDEAVCARLAVEQCLNWSGCDASSPAYRYVKDHIQKREKGNEHEL